MSKRASAKNAAYLGISLAILEAAKLTLDLLPNIEVVTLLFIVYTIFYGRKTLLVGIGFTVIECLLKGFNIWSLMYLYIWPLLIMLVFYANQHKVGYIFYCILSAFFGLFFGCFGCFLILRDECTAQQALDAAGDVQICNVFTHVSHLLSQ